MQVSGLSPSTPLQADGYPPQASSPSAEAGGESRRILNCLQGGGQVSHPLLTTPQNSCSETVRVDGDYTTTLLCVPSPLCTQTRCCRPRPECGMCAKYEVLSPLSRCSFPSPESFLLIAVFAIRNIYIFPPLALISLLYHIYPVKKSVMKSLKLDIKLTLFPVLTSELNCTAVTSNYCRSSPDTNPRHCNPIIQISPCSKCSLIVAFSQS